MYRHILAAGIVSMTLSTAAVGQSPPTDLTELDLEEILSLHIRRTESPEEAASRWSISYRLIFARFDGNRDGTQDLSIDDMIWDRDNGETRTRDNFPVVPTEINQQAHMVEIGYEVGPSLSLNLLIPFIHQSTDHCSIVAGFEEFVISSSGVGDVSLSASRPVWRHGTQVVVANLGVSLPLGSIDEIGPTPRDAENDTQLPYTMQIGSGTVDLMPGIAFSSTRVGLQWGARARATVRLGETDRDYSLGDRLSVSSWVQKEVRPWFRPVARLSLQRWGRIDGGDKDLQIDALPVSPYPAAVTDPSKFGGTKLHASLGAALTGRSASLNRHTLQLEAGLPVYQNLNGPQPKEIYRLSAGWKWSL